MKKIYEFKKGDKIVRIIPAKSLGPMMSLHGEVVNRNGDRSYLGEEMVFMGIANGQIYCKPTNNFHKAIFGDKLIDLPLDLWDDGWDFYVDPNTLMDGNETVIDKLTIEQQIQKAIDDEDYELAEKLKVLLQK